MYHIVSHVKRTAAVAATVAKVYTQPAAYTTRSMFYVILEQPKLNYANISYEFYQFLLAILWKAKCYKNNFSFHRQVKNMANKNCLFSLVFLQQQQQKKVTFFSSYSHFKSIDVETF